MRSLRLPTVVSLHGARRVTNTTLGDLSRLTDANLETMLQSVASEKQRRQPTSASNSTKYDKEIWRGMLKKFKTNPTEIMRPRGLHATGSEVFSHADLSLKYIKTYGFDYDYTMVHYSTDLLHMLYKEATKLIVQQGYPSKIADLSFDETFAIRGLYFDRKTGYLLKLDQFHKVMLDCVYYGREPVPPEKIIQAYHGVRISPVYKQLHLRMMTDLFCLPEATLYADVIQTLKDANLNLSPHHIALDVRKAFEHLHVSGHVHSLVMADLDKYIVDKNRDILDYLSRLREGGKKLFLLTNSPWRFVNAGMKHRLRKDLSPAELEDWPSLFDVVICSAGKPDWLVQ
jgi:HAD superfamily 5'-nucleotidase-like hydrolase